MLSEASGGTEARHMVAHRAHLSDLRTMEAELKERVAQQQAAVQRLRGELDAALDALIEASKEVQVIEKHKEGWQQQARRAEERRQQKLSDEIGSIMHGQKKREES
jgi:flagellar export protein FliJ